MKVPSTYEKEAPTSASVSSPRNRGTNESFREAYSSFNILLENSEMVQVLDLGSIYICMCHLQFSSKKYE